MNSGMKPKQRKKNCKNTISATGLCVRILCVFFSFIVLSACVANKSGTLPRPQPGYMGWLKKQSMVTQADSYIAEVSQSDKLWMRGAKEKRFSVLLRAAPTWLELNAFSMPGTQPLFRVLRKELVQLASIGIQGLYLGPVVETQDVWLDDGKKKSIEENGFYGASLAFDQKAGSDEDFELLAHDAEVMGLELGATLLPPATNIGPDFLLQARNATGHTGLYAMLAAPDSIWELLPPASQEWHCKSLSADAVKELANRNILPARIHKDGMPWAAPAGWASTGPVTGTDGRQRRWLYRFEKNPTHPVILWHDPSGLAKKIYSAAVIRQTGFDGIPLTGLSFSPLLGLDPVTGQVADNNHVAFLSPGLDALNEIADQIHRYGGWALQADAIPLESICLILAGSVDFCRDDLTEALLSYAMLFEDAVPLSNLYNRLLKQDLEISRLARGMRGDGGIRPEILLSLSNGNFIFNKINEVFNDSVISPAALQKKLVTKNHVRPGEAEYLVKCLCLDWRLGLPGIAFIEPFFMEKSDHDDIKVMEYLKKLLVARKKNALALGRVAVVKNSNASSAILTSLPDGGYWLMGTNFSKVKETLNVPLPRACKTAFDVLTGENLSENLKSGGQKFALKLDGHKGRHVIFSCD